LLQQNVCLYFEEGFLFALNSLHGFSVISEAGTIVSKVGIEYIMQTFATSPDINRIVQMTTKLS
jgi:hypothetical protein